MTKLQFIWLKTELVNIGLRRAMLFDESVT